MSKEQNRLLNLSEVAALIGVAISTVQAWCRSGKLPHIRLSARLYKVRESDLEQFLAAATR